MCPSEPVKCFFEYFSEEFSYSYRNESPYSMSIASHIHNGWEFLFIKQGELSYTVDGNVFDVTPGNLIISRPGAVHMMHPKGTIHYERHDILVSENSLVKTIMQKIPNHIHILDISEDHIIPDLFEKINYYHSKLPEEYLAPIYRALSNELWMNIYIHLHTPTQAITPHSNPVISKAIKYIKDHIHEQLTVRQICSALFISPTHLQHCFSQHIHVTPKQYILLQKLQLVHHELSNGASPTDVYRRYGFHNYSTFYRNYQKYYGCSPSDRSKQPPQDIYL